uniref:Phosphatidylinositol-glycan biosynthesis class W protein n=1 Tax=Nippostrongylus brasiliensis TaxID=27835 RepID=A0A0N4YGP8_NIPBR
MLRNVSLPWIFLGKRFNTSPFKYWFKFVMDFSFIALPPLLLMTVFSQSLLLLACILATCLATLCLFIICEYLISPERPSFKIVLNRLIDENQQPTTFVSQKNEPLFCVNSYSLNVAYNGNCITFHKRKLCAAFYRSSMLITVACAILAVDFPVFPRRLAKTEKYGHSLMDMGVAGFIFALAITSRLRTMNTWEGKTSTQKRFSWFRSSYVILPVIGMSRTILLTVLNYPQHVTEYGVHWNFFYTLALVFSLGTFSPTCLYISLKIISYVLPKKFPWLWACLFGTFQQTMLMNGYEEWILNGDNPRDTLISANAEGICSLMGYITIYYMADTLAIIRVKSWIECCWRLFAFALIFYGMQLGAEWVVGQASRRVVNITYIFAQVVVFSFVSTMHSKHPVSQMSLLTFALASFLGVQLVSVVAWAANVPHFSIDENPWCGVQPCLTASVNRSGLAFFLLANVLTGVVNFCIDTHHTDDVTALCILFGYLFSLCVMAHMRDFVKMNRRR